MLKRVGNAVACTRECTHTHERACPTSLSQPADQRNGTSMFYFGLGVNIFGGNVVAITQQVRPRRLF